MRHKVDLIGKNFGETRKDIRKNLVLIFLDEEPGTGKGEACSIYEYTVETLSNGEFVYLKRPARLNKGFDFEVNVSNTNFGKKRKTTRPNHDTIFKDLSSKKNENPKEYLKLRLLIDNLYHCSVVTDEEMNKLNFQSGYPVDLILKSIKWLFIEQDITYWNWSGRNMLYSGIQNIS
jgi:hypothetical protein